MNGSGILQHLHILPISLQGAGAVVWKGTLESRGRELRRDVGIEVPFYRPDIRWASERQEETVRVASAVPHGVREDRGIGTCNSSFPRGKQVHEQSPGGD